MTDLLDVAVGNFPRPRSANPCSGLVPRPETGYAGDVPAKGSKKPAKKAAKAAKKTTAKKPERLAKYQEMRDFSRTAEPAGEPKARRDGDAPMFVVQRHRARRLHYDVRLEIDGVLASWAVPKGPTLDPRARHLAVHVEDHPIEYADFEGTIPAGEYGGGDVIVWDRGTWEPVDDDPAAAIEAGTLHFDLHGEKLAGRFVLVRRGEKQWLLLHKKDEHAE